MTVRRAWLAWQVSVIDQNFGSHSFGMASLSVLLDAVDAVEAEIYYDSEE